MRRQFAVCRWKRTLVVVSVVAGARNVDAAAGERRALRVGLQSVQQGAAGAVCQQAAARAVELARARATAAWVPPGEPTDVDVNLGLGPTAVAGWWQATLELRRNGGGLLGVRRLEVQGQDCNALAEPLAAVLTVMVAVATSDAAPEPPPRLPWRAGLAARAALLSGVAPELTGGGALAATARKGSAWGELGVQGWLPNREAGPRGLTVWGGAVSLSLCGGKQVGIVEGRACAGADAGLVRASAFGYDVTHPQIVRTTDAVGRLGLAVLAGRRWAFTVDGEVGLALVRHRFTARSVEGAELLLWQPPRVAASVGAGFEVRLR